MSLPVSGPLPPVKYMLSKATDRNAGGLCPGVDPDVGGVGWSTPLMTTYIPVTADQSLPLPDAPDPALPILMKSPRRMTGKWISPKVDQIPAPSAASVEGVSAMAAAIGSANFSRNDAVRTASAPDCRVSSAAKALV